MRSDALMSDIIVPSGWMQRLESIVGRRRDTWVLMAVVTVFVGGGLALWSRGSAPQIAPPAVSPKGASFAAGGGAGPSVAAPPSPGPAGTAPPQTVTVAAGTEGAIFVHVAGAVRRPGLYQLPAGARVADAIDAARGPRLQADLNALNLAAALADGTKLDVPRRGESAGAVSSTTDGVTTTTTDGAATATAPSSGTTTSTAGPTDAATAPIPLNSADQVALETIPGVGPVTATAILEYRTEIGSFESIDQLLDVSGIGPATLESIRPYVTI